MDCGLIALFDWNGHFNSLIQKLNDVQMIMMREWADRIIDSVLLHSPDLPIDAPEHMVLLCNLTLKHWHFTQLRYPRVG